MKRYRRGDVRCDPIASNGLVVVVVGDGEGNAAEFWTVVATTRMGHRSTARQMTARLPGPAEQVDGRSLRPQRGFNVKPGALLEHVWVMGKYLVVMHDDLWLRYGRYR